MATDDDFLKKKSVFCTIQQILFRNHICNYRLVYKMCIKNRNPFSKKKTPKLLSTWVPQVLAWFFFQINVMAECSFQNGCLLFSIGRRWCLFLYAVSCAFTLSCILVINLTKAMNTQVDMMLGITIFGKLGVTSTIVLILLVTLEVYPTSIR